ncbi:DUF1972 domain-containing protein [Aquipuribacter sp. SD81]|uniref:DUF1972 domain-containing protein n=1 Tax=Aquipuribacter sp. SD81 TaxID=3127703 RepID=UPI003015B878
MKIALIGTRGVPARYGGFETAVEEVGRRLVDRGHQVTVYCRGGGADAPARHLGMDLVHLPAVRHRTAETLSHTTLSVLHQALRPADVAIVFNAANAPLLPVLRARRIPTAVHVDGLEWQRGKWGRAGRAWYRRSERLAVRLADALIADARGIQDYYRQHHGAPSWFIPYGAPDTAAVGSDKLAGYDLRPDGYHLVVARMEPENHVHLSVQGYVRSRAELPLVVVGGAPYDNGYGADVRAAAGGDPRVRFLGPVWDQDALDQLYAHSRTYLHGHSVGGTNPSLLRAAGAAAPVTAFDVAFNREVVAEEGRYFSTADHVAEALHEAEDDPSATAGRGRRARELVLRRYCWDAVTEDYEQLLEATRAGTGHRPTGSCAAPAAPLSYASAHDDG